MQDLDLARPFPAGPGLPLSTITQAANRCVPKKVVSTSPGSIRSPRDDKGNSMVTYQFMSAWLTSRIRSERAASLVEYALLVALIAVVCIAAVTFLGSTASNKFNQVGSSIG